MTYCPECGSEVAPENTFCAYCGIGLTPILPFVEEEASSNDISFQTEKNEDLNSFESTPKFETASQNESEASAAENEIQASDAQPSTPLLEMTKAVVDSVLDAFDSKKEESADSDTLETFPVRTEPVQSSLDVEDSFKIEENFAKPSFEKPVKSHDFKASEEDFISRDEYGFEIAPAQKSNEAVNSPEKIDSADVFSQKGSPVSFESNELIEKPEEKGVSDNQIEPDLQSTVPYIPMDYVSQELLSSKISGTFKDVDEKEVKSSENQNSIAMPQSPVGSSQYDSLEPTLISVQIYKPDEQPKKEPVSLKEESVPSIDPSIYDSQTLMRQDPVVQQKSPPAAKSNELKEGRSYTSPNMGKEDTDGRNKAKLKPLDEGTVLNGRYEIVRKIGGGGMGAVYLASDRNLGGVLRAVKEMVQSYIEDAQQEKAINDFRRESLLLTSLEHHSIPTIFDYFFDETEGRFYLVMKYISGGDLAARLRSAPEGRIDEASVIEWAIQIADVLDYLHNRQPPIIYRDLKPSNVMIDGNSGRAMLIDFGIARWVNKEEKGVTAVGTMGYAPPELFSGNVEPRSDIYSLGSTMFHLLTGADPQSNPLLIFDFHKNPRPRQINSRLSDQIEQILMRMVEYSYDKRFASAAELRDALIKHLENLRKGSVTFGAGDRAAPAQAANELVFCGFCGQKIVATDMFCPFCGAQQPLPGQGAKASAYVAPKLTARVMVIGTNELDTPMFNLEKDNNLVGRRDPMSNIFPEVDLSKFDPQTKISRRHARIWRQSDTFMLEDLGSSNGTVLITKTNEPLRLTKNQPHVLAHGDKIRLGDTMLHFMIG